VFILILLIQPELECLSQWKCRRCYAVSGPGQQKLVILDNTVFLWLDFNDKLYSNGQCRLHLLLAGAGKRQDKDILGLCLVYSGQFHSVSIVFITDECLYDVS
jgi:hypothetical protein